MPRLILAACITAFCASAAGALSLLHDTSVVVTRGSAAGPTVYGPEAAAEPCRISPNRRARLYFTVSDPAGIDYAAVKLGAATVRPAVSDHVEAYLWVAPGTRDDRAYRWRLNDEGSLQTRRTIPVAVEVVGNPIEVAVEVKDGAGKVADISFRLDARAVLCR